MGPHAGSKTLREMEMTSLDLVEGDMSISDIQRQGRPRRRIAMNAAKRWREHYTRRLLKRAIRDSVITMVVNGRSMTPSAACQGKLVCWLGMMSSGEL
jgi:hypothetical protein